MALSAVPARSRVLRWLLSALLVVGAPVALYHLSVEPGASLVRFIFNNEREVSTGKWSPYERPDVQVDRVDIAVDGAPDTAVNLWRPVKESKHLRPVILWVHGGGFVAGDADSVAGFSAVMAARGYVVAALDYSLAPEHTYPTPVIQGNAALGWLRDVVRDFGGDPRKVIIGGDSAGAQIASQLAAVQSIPGFGYAMGITPALSATAVQAVLLYCGFFDMSTVASTGFPALRTYLWSYTGQRDWERFDRLHELSLTEHLSASYPPILLAVGDADPFAPESKRLAELAKRQGVQVETVFWQDRGLGHSYQFDYRLPESQETLTRTLEFLKEQL